MPSMYKVGYYDLENIAETDLSVQGELRVYDDGFYLDIRKTKDNRREVRINDEMVDEFSQETIDLLSKHFPIKDPIIQSTWEKEWVDPPYHDNDLTFAIGKDVSLKDLIKFIFQKIYQVDDWGSLPPRA